MDKHAYLIMTHGNFKILEKQLRLLDDQRNDIFIHVDKKVKDFDFNYFSGICQDAYVQFAKKRIDVKWGGVTQVLTELLLFEEASESYHRYYHLLSGVDLPLHCQEYIHAFFEQENREFIVCLKEDRLNKWDYQRLSRYRLSSKIHPWILAKINALQETVHIDRLKKYNLSFTRGRNWCSLTHDAVRYLIENKKMIKRMTRFSVCADEVYKQLLLCNSSFVEMIYMGENGDTDDLRLVDWTRRVKDSPHTFTVEDYDMIIKSPNFFARKFDEKTDMCVVEMIYNKVREEQGLAMHNVSEEC